MIVHGVHPPPQAQGGEHRERLVLRLPIDQAAQEVRQQRALPLHLEDPVEQLKNNVWIAPYYEDDVKLLADTIGWTKILFGSDWPHRRRAGRPDLVHRRHSASSPSSATRTREW